ncbi:MAG TPA: LysR family transcriptional regulator [Chromatiaceae bacterium]|nr:LysR family transcriptional regulator [Chromatiaceae bacterium]
MYLQISHLRSLRALAETGSLTAAAQRLCLTQSALSHQIRGLEEHFGTRLFQRKSRPLQFSAAGEKLLELARATLPCIQECENSLMRMAEGMAGRLHIGIECHSCFQWLMPVLDRYRESWPEVELDLTLGHSFEPMPALRSGNVDLVISSDPVADPDLCFRPLFSYESLLVVAAGHPLADQAIVHPGDLSDKTLITYPVSPARLDVFSVFLQPAGVQPAQIRHVELTPMIMQLVASNRGVAVLPSWALHEYRDNPRLCFLSLGEGGIQGTLYAGMRSDDLDKPYVQGFLQQARDTCFEQLPGIEPVLE